jgi:hypothetical protein
MMPVDLMFVLATAAFAWGLSLATYKLFAHHNDWPMGAWHVERPGLPIAIGVAAVAIAVLFALARGGATLPVLVLFGIMCALAWTAVTRVGSQTALLLAPLAAVALLVVWGIAMSGYDDTAGAHRVSYPTSLDNESMPTPGAKR